MSRNQSSNVAAEPPSLVEYRRLVSLLAAETRRGVDLDMTWRDPASSRIYGLVVPQFDGDAMGRRMEHTPVLAVTTPTGSFALEGQQADYGDRWVLPDTVTLAPTSELAYLVSVQPTVRAGFLAEIDKRLGVAFSQAEARTRELGLESAVGEARGNGLSV